MIITTSRKDPENGPDITGWLEWYLKCYVRGSEIRKLTARVMAKQTFGKRIGKRK